ncbi:hypothetical protein [Nocardia terpenica]|uniref:Uncharacterized protein n=1 Tax=Nocardia terpenica TaxID=455432 RepID=A0A291RSB7_9NOCA|nr:hypothetical protein [Nocardia terpenica]ATL70521.1 hypothetical protein CRH09_34430 [Nocardia terpenica]
MTTVTIPVQPSVHIRAVVTWLAIFSLVAAGMTAMAPFTAAWHPILRALLLTAVVVPCAVYFVVPRLLRVHHSIALRRRVQPVHRQGRGEQP